MINRYAEYFAVIEVCKLLISVFYEQQSHTMDQPDKECALIPEHTNCSGLNLCREEIFIMGPMLTQHCEKSGKLELVANSGS